jgi:hypothetical protein
VLGARQPDQREHQVMGPGFLAEVHVVDQVVLELVRQRREERDQRDARPGRQCAVRVGPGAANHAGERKDEDQRADCVLVAQPRMLRAQAFTGAQDFAADVFDLVLVGFRWAGRRFGSRRHCVLIGMLLVEVYTNSGVDLWTADTIPTQPSP